MSYATIKNGIVVSVQASPISGDDVIFAGPVVIGWQFNDNTFSPPIAVAPTPTLNQIKTAKIADLTAVCGKVIENGFSSSALGQAYSYPCKTTDEINLAASIAKSQLRPSNTFPFWCDLVAVDSAGNTSHLWQMRTHTAAQIQQVGLDAYDYVLSMQQKLLQLTILVNAAQTADAINSISWS